MRLVVLAAAVLAALAVSSAAGAATSYCSPSGDYCTSTARVNGTVLLRVTTFSFQGPAFYRRHGYEVFGELPEFPADHKRYFLKKQL